MGLVHKPAENGCDGTVLGVRYSEARNGLGGRCFYRWMVDEMYYGAGHSRCLVIGKGGSPQLKIGTKQLNDRQGHGDVNCWYTNTRPFR